MSLGVGAELGVSSPGQKSIELVNRWYDFHGSYVNLNFGAGALTFLFDKLQGGITGGSRRNGYAIESGILKECRSISITNTTTSSVVLEIWESASDIIATTKLAEILTIPAGQKTVVTVTGLSIPITRGKYYEFKGVKAIGGASAMSLWFSCNIDFGTNPPITKFASLYNYIALSNGFGSAFFALHKNLFVTTVSNTRCPIPFNCKITKVVLNKVRVPASGTYFFHIYKNGVSVYNVAMPLVNGEIQIESPNVSFVKGDDFNFLIIRSNSANAKETNVSIFFEAIS